MVRIQPVRGSRRLDSAAAGLKSVIVHTRFAPQWPALAAGRSWLTYTGRLSTTPRYATNRLNLPRLPPMMILAA